MEVLVGGVEATIVIEFAIPFPRFRSTPATHDISIPPSHLDGPERTLRDAFSGPAAPFYTSPVDIRKAESTIASPDASVGSGDPGVVHRGPAW